MFANRFTALVDACVLVGVQKRNLILTLAEAEFFRVRWSDAILEETRAAVERILSSKGDKQADRKAARSISAMKAAFEEAIVTGYETFLPSAAALPDPGDAHLIAAALKTRASVIVTDNLKDFPRSVLSPLNLDARSADDFIADTIALDEGRAVAALRRMRLRLNRPEKTTDQLLLDLEAVGLTATVDVLRPYVASL